MTDSTQYSPDAATYRHHLTDEREAAYLYRILASAELNLKKRDVYERLARVEDQHVEIWSRLIKEQGWAVPPFKPGLRTKLLAFLGQRFGPGFLLPVLLSEEGREVKGYFNLHREMPEGAAGKTETLALARESAEHANVLSEVAGKGGEPWHHAGSGGILRNVIYGFNDGLTANFGLVAGVIGATASSQYESVIVAGVAGLIADALSMGSSGYLAAKSEQEVYANEIAMERQEIALMPELEREELALLYEAKGLRREAAEALSKAAMANPQRALEEKVREELKIGDRELSPMREGWITGLATAVGAIIPVFPFVVAEGVTALAFSFVLSMLSHFLVGGARSIFTGRGIFRSGIDMFVVGLGVAVIGYIVGEWVAKLL